MSDGPFAPRPAKYLGIASMENGWRVKLYFCSSPEWAGSCDTAQATRLACDRIAEMERDGFSDEFQYLRLGFFISHFGRRGMTLSLFHYGLWVDMPEVFAASWYSTGHSGLNFSRLDFREPVVCIHEIPIATAEMKLFWEMIGQRSCATEEGTGALAQGYLAAGNTVL